MIKTLIYSILILTTQIPQSHASEYRNPIHPNQTIGGDLYNFESKINVKCAIKVLAVRPVADTKNCYEYDLSLSSKNAKFFQTKLITVSESHNKSNASGKFCEAHVIGFSKSGDPILGYSAFSKDYNFTKYNYSFLINELDQPIKISKQKLTLFSKKDESCIFIVP